MSVIARFSIPAEQFALGAVLEVREGIRIRLESMVPTGDALIPYFWVPNQDADAIHAVLGESPLVTRVEIVDRVESEALFRVEWSDDVNGLIDVIRDSEAVLLEADGLGDDWSFRARFSDHEALSAFYRRCVEEGLTLDLTEVNNLFGSTRRTGPRLTDPQQEALLTALEKGYFDVPRRITLEELAAELGISDTAFSQRLNRGLKTLLSSGLKSHPATGRHDDEEERG